MPKWLRRVILGIIALLIFAATYPNVILPGGGIWVSALAGILCLAFVPALLVCIFTGRNETLEYIGWGGHFVALAAVFLR